jgi:hypothetical protein
VGRPGLDPGTVGAIDPSPGLWLNVQIRWSNELGRAPLSSDILPGLLSWLDNGSCAGLSNVRIESSGGEVIEYQHGNNMASG